MCWVLRAWVEMQGLLTIVDVVNGMGISHANKKERQDAIEHAQALATESERCGRWAEGAGAVDQRQAGDQDDRASECAQVRRKEAHRVTARWLWVATRFIQNNTSDRHVCVTRPSQESGGVQGNPRGIGRARAGQRCCNSETRSRPRVTGVGARTGLLLAPCF